MSINFGVSTSLNSSVICLSFVLNEKINLQNQTLFEIPNHTNLNKFPLGCNKTNISQIVTSRKKATKLITRLSMHNKRYLFVIQ